MKALKSIFSLTFGVIILCAVCFGFAGCEEGYNKFETEYFVCREYNNRIAIPELTELGKEQEILIVPETMRNKKVEMLGIYVPKFMNSYSYSNWQSDKLKKLFLMSNVGVPFAKHDLPNLKEIYIFNASKENETSLADSGNQWSIYIPNVFDIIFQDKHHKFFTANVGYFYNYADSPNNDYYFIDNYLYGEKITFQPPSPERKGYTFSGWYKEVDCIKAWNFNADILPSVLLDDNEKEVYQETKLYAKWIKN